MKKTGNIQRYYEIYSILLPICIVAKAFKALHMYCHTVFGCQSKWMVTHWRWDWFNTTAHSLLRKTGNRQPQPTP